MGKYKKRYIGCFKTEIEAARMYDYFSIMHYGLKAKVNFDYTKTQLLKLCDSFEALDIVDINKQRFKKCMVMKSIVEGSQ